MPLGQFWCHGNPVTSLEPFVENPPKIFAFDNDTLPREELKRVRDTWKKNARFAVHARHADIQMSLRRQEYGQVRRYASRFEGHAYLLVPRFVPWKEARTFSEKLGGHLATITSPEEQKWVAKTFAGNVLWLGATDEAKDGEWGWVTGEKWDFTNWGPGEPNNRGGGQHYLRTYPDGTWDDVRADLSSPFVVEWEE